MLLPVWFMTFDYNGRLWEYAINGQSGKVAGELPISKRKLIGFCAAIGFLVAMLIFIGGYFLS